MHLKIKFGKRLFSVVVIMLIIAGVVFSIFRKKTNSLVMNDSYIYLKPKNHAESYVVPDGFLLHKEDWIPLKKTFLTKYDIKNELNFALGVLKSQYPLFNISAWEINPILSLINNQFLITSDSFYLDIFSDFYAILSQSRGDTANIVFYDGTKKPQWPRLDRFNIFFVSPFIDYSKTDKTKLMAARNWSSLKFSDANYTGLFLDQMLRFVQIIQYTKLSHYSSLANTILNDAIKVAKSHESEWVSLADGTGYYIFPKNSPFYIDGIEMPINEISILGTSIVRLYLLTGDKFWLNRALAMYGHWKKYFDKDQDGYVTYPYAIGELASNRSSHSNSLNSPNIRGVNNAESFHKAALTVKFLIMLSFVDRSLEQLVKEFYKILLASKDISWPLSPFPNCLSFQYSKDIYHTHLPISFDGLAMLLVNDLELTKNAFFLVETFLKYSPPQKNDLPPFSLLSALDSLIYYSQNNFTSTLETNRLTIKPYIGLDLFSDKKCQLRSNKSALAFLKFSHKTPKRNRLFLYLDSSYTSRTRLEITPAGHFEGYIFLPKRYCLNLFWNQKLGVRAFPGSESENKVDVFLISPGE